MVDSRRQTAAAISKRSQQLTATMHLVVYVGANETVTCSGHETSSRRHRGVRNGEEVFPGAD